MTESDTSGFDVSVVTMADTTKRPPTVDDIRGEISALKIAILYGNHVDLFSGVWRTWDLFLNLDDPETALATKSSYLKYIRDRIGPQERRTDKMAVWNELIKYADGEHEGFAPERLAAHGTLLRSLWPRLMEDYLNHTLPEWKGVRRLIDDERLRIVDMYGSSAEDALSMAQVTEFMRKPGLEFFPVAAYDMIQPLVNYVNNVHHAVMGSEIPVLDKKAAEFLHWRTADKKAAVNARARAAPFAGRLFARIPTFSSATLDEIIDIRVDLAPCISGFQQEILSLSTSMLDIPEPDLDFEVEKLFQEKIKPQLDELNLQIRNNRYLRQLTGTLASDWKSTATLVGAVAGAAMGTTQGGVSQLVTTALGAGAVTGPGVKAFFDSRRAEETIAQHKFYFLHQLTEKLGTKESRPKQNKRRSKKKR